MTLVLIIGLILVGTAAALLVRSVLLSRLQTAATLDQIGHYGFVGVVEQNPTSGLRAIVDDFASMVGGFFVDRLGLFNEPLLRKQLISAGMYRTSARMLM